MPFQHEFLMKFLSSDFTKTCFSCRRELNFKESEGLGRSTESNEKSAKFRRQISKNKYANIPNFGLVLAPKIDPTWHQTSQDAPKYARYSQNASKIRPRWSQGAPGMLPSHPKCTQNCAKMLPRCCHDASTHAQHAPRLSRGAPKMLPKLPRCSQDASKADFGTQNSVKTIKMSTESIEIRC